MKFNLPSFLAGLVVGIVATFAILNGGACRPSPTPTDEGTPVKVEAPKVEIAAPSVAGAAPIAPTVEVKPEAPVSVPPVADAKAPMESKAAPVASSAIAVTVAPVPE